MRGHTVARNHSAIAAAALAVLLGCILAGTVHAEAADRIRPYEANPYYWQYKGRPVLLLGGSWQDNLFNHPVNLAQHLDLLVSVGGNYVRNTMSHRNAGNVFPFAQSKDGLFDLARFNEAYWERFEHFLKLTHERDIIVQIEIWDPHDHYRDRETYGGWSYSPYNPVNNINYTAEESGLPVKITYGVQPRPTEHAFWRTVPALHNNARVLAYQMAFVDKMLEYSLKYPHVIYCMNNEIGEPTEWGDFWARHVLQRAAEAGVTVFTADMRRDHNIRTPDHHRLYDQPDLYTFLDISQVTGAGGQRHYDDVIYVRDTIARNPRPINNVKNYGAAKQSEQESIARFFRFIFAGGASTRFHRPHPIEDPQRHEEASYWGLGLSPRAQATIRAMREVDGRFDIFRSAPRNDLLSGREPNEAYLLATPGEQYAVYLPSAGSVMLDLSAFSEEFVLRRLDLDILEWREEGAIAGGSSVTLSAPSPVKSTEDAPEPRDVIVNGSFELALLPPSPGYTGSIPGWSTEEGPGHIINDASGPFYTAELGPIPHGKQLYGKQGVGRLSQTIVGIQNGRPFTLSFRVNCRTGNGGMDLAVKLGQQVIWSRSVAPSQDAFERITYEGIYDSASGNTLVFEFTNPQGDSTLLLDDVQLMTIPAFGGHSVVVISRA